MIGIITLYYNNKNYGGLLQSYALQKFISERYGECEQISYVCTNSTLIDKAKNNLLRISFSDVLCIVYKIILKKIYEERNLESISLQLTSRKELIQKFEKEIRHSEVVDINNVETLSDKYSYLISGSDQVWCGGIDLPRFLLNFAGDNTIKISYAASAAGEKFNRLQEKSFQKYLNQFSAISVREKNMKRALTKYTKKKIEIVVDPVFLLEVKQWKKLVDDSQLVVPREKYIFCYYLGKNENQIRMVKRIAKKYQLKLVTIPFIGEHCNDISDLEFGDICFKDVGPKEFLNLIYHAEYVVTDSFHAMAFSVIFEKNFVVTERYGKKDIGYGNSRIINFLDEYGLSEHLCKDVNEMKNSINCTIDYSTVKTKLEVERIKSIEWLDKIISL